jgi:hypothetical protein
MIRETDKCAHCGHARNWHYEDHNGCDVCLCEGFTKETQPANPAGCICRYEHKSDSLCPWNLPTPYVMSDPRYMEIKEDRKFRGSWSGRRAKLV